MKAKLKSNSGMSLMEMICAIGISLLIGVAIITGIDFATRYYKRTASTSEANILSSTLTAAVTDELRYIGSFKADSDGNITEFFSQSFGKLSGGFGSDDGIIIVGSGADAHLLLSSNAYTNGLKAYIDVKYRSPEGVFKVKLTVMSGSNTLVNEFEVSPLNAAYE